jgi:hypothetical protein
MMRTWLAAGLVIGAITGALAAYSVTLVPLRMEQRQLSYVKAEGRLRVDTRLPLLATTHAKVGPINERARFMSQFVASPGVTRRLAKRAGITADELVVSTAANRIEQIARITREPIADERAYAIARSPTRQKVRFQIQYGLPIVDFEVKAPTQAEALRLAKAIVPSLREALVSQARGETPAVVIDGVVNPETSSHGLPANAAVAALVAALISAVWALLGLALRPVARGFRALRSYGSSRDPGTVGA